MGEHESGGAASFGGVDSNKWDGKCQAYKWVCSWFWGSGQQQVGKWTTAEKKEKEWAIALGFGLGQQIQVESGPSQARIGPRLKDMGLGGAMGGMGSVCLQLHFRTLFDVLALIFFTNIGSMQG